MAMKRGHAYTKITENCIRRYDQALALTLATSNGVRWVREGIARQASH